MRTTRQSLSSSSNKSTNSRFLATPVFSFLLRVFCAISATFHLSSSCDLQIILQMKESEAYSSCQIAWHKVSELKKLFRFSWISSAFNNLHNGDPI